MNRLIIIDGNAILHRAFHALPPLTTRSGESVNAVYGFTAMLLRVVSDLTPSHVAVTFDRPGPSFREALYVGYQAQRPKMDKDLSSQIDIVHTVVQTLGVPIFEMDGYEADDVIGTLAVKAQDDCEVIIVTGDRDILQLVNVQVKVYMPIKGLSHAKLYGQKEVEEKFGVKATQIIDYKSLVGDQSDNYPGVSGIGPKTASELLKQFETLEGVYQHVGEIGSEKTRKALIDGSESAALAKKLATICTTVPIEFALESCRLKNFDRPQVHFLFQNLEFTSLSSRLSSSRAHLRALQTKNEGSKKTVSESKKAQQISLF